jgi:multicomponent Na+:H+ antiporter subunit F
MDMSILVTVTFGLLILAIFVAFVRLVRGPSLPARVVALDLMGSLVVGFIAIYAVATDQPIFLDVAIVLALIGFLGTVAFAYFIEKGELPWQKAESDPALAGRDLHAAGGYRPGPDARRIYADAQQHQICHPWE